MCVFGGYGGMTLTNTTLKRDPSTTNPAMMSSRGRKQLTLVDNKTIRYVSAGTACSGTWRLKEEAVRKVLMRNSSGSRRSGQQLSKWYEKLAPSHRWATLKRPAEIQQSLQGFIKRRGSHNLHSRWDSATSMDILKDPAVKGLKSSQFR